MRVLANSLKRVWSATSWSAQTRFLQLVAVVERTVPTATVIALSIFR
jgi:hypothetical protein